MSNLITSWCNENLKYIRDTQLTTDYYVTINKIITRFIFSDVTTDSGNKYNMYDLSIEVLDLYIGDLCKELSGNKLDYQREWKRLKTIGGFGHNTIDMDKYNQDIKNTKFY